MSWGSILSSAWDWFSGDSFSASLAKTAILAYGMNKLSDSISNSSNDTEQPDLGQRIQVNPSTSHKIPVLYGEAFFGGAITDVELTSDYKTIRYCVTLAEQTGNLYSTSSASSYTFNDVYINNNRVVFKADGYTVDYTLDISGNQDISLQDQVKIYMYAPDPLQPDGYAGTTPAADTVMTHWAEVGKNYAMTGLVYAIVEVTYNRAKNVTGIPECKFHMTNSMILPGDCLYDYMTNTRYGGKIPVSEIDTTSLTALNSYATTGFTVTLPDTTSSTITYGINGLLDTSKNVLDNMEMITDNCNTWLSYDIMEGYWTTVINQAGSSVATFTDDNIVGSISVTSTALSQLNSTVEVKFQNSTILDKEDYVRITLDALDLLDNEPETVLELTFPLINRQGLAQKLGLQNLKQGRVDKIINFTTDYSYLNVKAGDVISVTSSPYGFTAKDFRVMEVEEVEGDDGSILINFTCLEYDADVYSYTPAEYTIETDDGLLGIGTIGVPGTPQFSKIEADRRPRVRLESVSPSGVVEALEFWVTDDTGVAESERTYRLLSTRYPTELTTETWPEGTNVTYEDDTLATGDYYIKTRGVNSIVVGPFSAPSGIIEYVPVQTTDALSPDTGLFDSLGGLVGALTLFSLLNKLFELFDDTTVEESIFDRIFNLFKEDTGVDLVEQASSGALGLSVQDEGTEVSSSAGTLNFTGQGVTASAAGGTVTVNVSVPQEINGVVVQNEPEDGYHAVFVGQGDLPGYWWAEPSCCERIVMDLEAVFTMELDQCRLTEDTEGVKPSRLPPDRDTFYELGGIEDVIEVPHTGSYFIRYTPDGMIHPLDKGYGRAFLYLSDGTLVETLDPADMIVHGNVLELPFADRIKGSDYYIRLKENAVQYCGCMNEAIGDPGAATFEADSEAFTFEHTWNFNVAPYDVDPYTIDDISTDGLSLPGYRVPFENAMTPKVYSPDSAYCEGSLPDLEVVFEETIVAGEGGQVKLWSLDADGELDTLVHTFQMSDGTISNGEYTYIDEDSGNPVTVTVTNGKISFGDISSYVSPYTSYKVVFDDKFLMSSRGNPTASEEVCGTTYQRNIKSGETWSYAFNFNFSMYQKLELIDAYAYTNKPSLTQDTKSNLRTDIRIRYNKAGIKVGTGQNIYLYKGDGTLIQTFDLTDTHETDRVSELWTFATTDPDLANDVPSDWEGDVNGYDTIILNPTHMLLRGTEYYVLIDSGCIWDEYCNVAHAGTSDVNLLRFTTDELYLTDDAGYAPAPTDQPLNSMVVLMPTDRNYTAGTGDIEIRDAANNLVMTIPASSPAVSQA